SSHQPLIEVRVLGENLLHNLAEFKKNYPKLEFAPVLKSNAYGHGIVGVAKILDQKNVPFFCVDSFFEARQLRHEGIKTKILIIGFTRPEEIVSCRLKNVAFAVTGLEQLREMTRSLVAPRSGLLGMTLAKKIHLKIDTGMHRQGILISEIEEAIKIIKNNKNIILEGICSHLADADNEDQKFTLEQIENWNRAAKIFKENFSGLKYLHLSATSGAGFAEKIDANVARLGLGLYGIDPSPSPLTKGRDGERFLIDNKPHPNPLLRKERGALNLKPALEIRTIITSVKEIEPGEKVGYGATFTADQKMKIATVPAGYFEGVDRRLSNFGFVKVKNIFCPIVGRVSMNITTIDVGAVANVKVGDEAILISQNPDDKNSVENITKLCNTISYEILVRIPNHLKRIIL
ncbi:MAG: alanine racemase, partial [Patescibacteria group bacterium]|nr:alanine racemase [Patescibacteria group bacterium]